MGAPPQFLKDQGNIHANQLPWPVLVVTDDLVEGVLIHLMSGQKM